MGCKHFVDVTAGSALRHLQALLSKLSFPDVSIFNTKAFRLGHSEVGRTFAMVLLVCVRVCLR